VDIGSLDVALLVHYPGTIASTWQQAGRAGRQLDESLAVLITSNDPVDQYLARHPEYFFSQSPEHAVIDPENPYVLANHLRAASFELPLQSDKIKHFGNAASPITTVLSEAGQLSEIDGKFYFAGGQNPAHEINLRHMSDDTFSIVLVSRKETAELRAVSVESYTAHYKRIPHPTNDSELAGTRKQTNDYVSRHQEVATPVSPDFEPVRQHRLPDHYQVIANVDAISAPELVYPEAVYLHHGETYFVRELDLSGKMAYVERCETDYYTQAVLESNVLITQQRTEKDWMAGSSNLAHANVCFGDVDVSWKTVGFKKIKFETRENVGFGSVDIPAQNLVTTAFWLTPGRSIRAAMRAGGYRTSQAICGLRNLAVVALPMVAMCDSRDVSGVVDSQNLGTTTLIVYDRYPGGLGYCEKGYQCIDTLLRICHEIIAECTCSDGCPSCVGLPNQSPAIHSDPDLSRGYPFPDKLATQQILELLLGSVVQAAAV
jgi:DEAD/DEAH box helicase domain-containing protein